MNEPLLLQAIDASMYEFQRKIKRDIDYQIQAIKGRAESAYQRIQLR